MRLHLVACLRLLAALGLILFGNSWARAQTVPRPARETARAPRPAQPELILAVALRANPLTAPYPIATNWQKGVVVLSGRVGTKQIHDAAIRTAIETGVRFRDDLVIDTGAAHAVALGAAGGVPAGSPSLAVSAPTPYIYPEPVMGWLDDPFFGLVPPIVSFPPWWRARTEPPAVVQPRRVEEAAGAGARREASHPTAAGPVGRIGNPPYEFGREPSAPNGPGSSGWQPLESSPIKGQIEIRVDELGQVFLRGIVASEEAGREIEQAARSVPGVTRVETEFEVQPRRAGSEAPPPPPQPMLVPEPPRSLPKAPAAPSARTRPDPVSAAPAALEPSDLTRRVVAALKRRTTTENMPIKVRSAGGTVTLSGQVPSAYEAMIAYRAAQQTPGVREIVDHLDFTVPDDDHPNPLVQKGRPEDVEPYLASQIRRHLGDLGQLDRVQARGIALELRGTLLNADDQDRLQAILRSMPLLKGFHLDPLFRTDQEK
jgi:osmotically-inducible protein OsmY